MSHHEHLLEPALLCKQMTSSSSLRSLPLLGHVCPELSLLQGMSCELAAFFIPSQMSESLTFASKHLHSTERLM